MKLKLRRFENHRQVLFLVIMLIDLLFYFINYKIEVFQGI